MEPKRHAPSFPPVLWGVLALAGALRFLRLGTQCFWVDEIASLLAAKTPLRYMAAWYQIDPHPPLFYTAMKVWLVFGESEWALRSFSALAGVGVVAATWWLGRSLTDARTAAWGAALLAVNPLAVWVSQELRGMALLGLLATLSLALLVRAVRDASPRARLGFVLVTVAMCYTHYFALFALAFEIGWAAWATRRDAARFRRIAVLFLAVGLSCLPWLPFFRSQFLGHGQAFRAHRSVPRVLELLAFYFTTSHSPWKAESFFPFLTALQARGSVRFDALASLLLLPFAVAFAAGFLAAWRKGSGTRILAASVAVQTALVLLASRAVDLFEPKYLVALLPATCLLTADGLQRIGRRSRWAAGGMAAWMLVLTALALSHHYADPDYRKPDWRSFSAFAARDLSSQDAVLVYFEPTISDFLYYYRRAGAAAPVFPILDYQPAGAPRVLDAAQVEGALARLGPRRSVWFFEGMEPLHDPDRIARATLDRDWERTASFPVQQWRGLAFVRYAPRKSGG